jgi:methyltransferase-like protein
LAEENNPLLFTDFAAHAKQHGLEFIAEADLAGTFAESYMPALARAVRQASQNDMLKTQQYLDYFLGRTFRMSILVKEEYIAALDRRVTHEGLKTLAFAVKGPIHKDGPLLSADGMPAFESTFAAYSNGSDAMLVQTPASERAMDFLSSPLSMATGTLTVQTLAEYVFATDAPTESELREMSSLISELFRRRLVQLWSIPFHWAKVSEKPKAFAILRSDALHGHEYSTLIAHEPIHFAFPSTRVFLTLLDGTRDRAALQAELVKRVESGALKLESLNYDFEGIEAEDVAEACRIYVDITLNNFAKFRMLES